MDVNVKKAGRTGGNSFVEAAQAICPLDVKNIAAMPCISEAFFCEHNPIRRAGGTGVENTLSILQIELGALPVFMSRIVMGVHRMVEQMAEKHLFRPSQVVRQAIRWI